MYWAMLALMVWQGPVTTLSEEAVRKQTPILRNQLETFWIDSHALGLDFEYPRMAAFHDELPQGQVGVFKDYYSVHGNEMTCSLEVFQVISPTSFLAHIVNGFVTTSYNSRSGVETNREHKQFKTLVLVEGLPTEDLTDGQEVKTADAFIVEGTYQYETVAGTGKKIPVIKRVALPPIPKSKAMIGIGVRDWKDATGKFSVSAAFESVADGVVKLGKTDGTTIDVPLVRLDEESKKLVREIMREMKDKERAEAQAEAKKKAAKRGK
jgi:hypothetical protein